MTGDARGIMTTSVISANEEQTLKEVIELLAKHKYSGLPVVDSDNRVVGIISETDIVSYSHKVSVIPFADLSGWISPYTDVADMASLRKGVELLTRTKVGQVMTRKVYTVTADTDAHDVAVLMSRRNINRVPVVDKDGKLLGIVTRADMVRKLAGS